MFDSIPFQCDDDLSRPRKSCGEERTIEIPAAVSPDGSSLHIVSSHILPEQEIEFEADIRN